MRHFAIAACALALLAAGCAGSEEASTPAPDQVSTPAPSATPPADEPATTPPTTEPPAEDDAGLPSIEGLTAAEGAGLQPLLQWEPVSGAATYDVVLYDPAGAAYGAWSGTAAAVVVGDGAVDPTIAEGMSWAVLAYDDDGAPVAASAQLPIAP
jgi:hypothetical protein